MRKQGEGTQRRSKDLRKENSAKVVASAVLSRNENLYVVVSEPAIENCRFQIEDLESRSLK
jgi:hypothetical protein